MADLPLTAPAKVYDYAGVHLNNPRVAVDIDINLTDGVPLYRQIVNQIRYMVASGVLEVGEELPPIRTLALQLKVTPNTIVKAYDELQAAGVVVKRHGSGTFVSDAGPSRLATRSGGESSRSGSTRCWPRRGALAFRWTISSTPFAAGRR